MSLSKALYKKPTWLWLLSPLSLCFWLVQVLRRTAYTLNIFSQYRSSLPVVVVGNITMGGNGKTPIVLSLVQYYLDKGLTPAVLSRGYGGEQTSFPHLVSKQCPANLVGDEPSLIRHRFDIPVVIDPKRARGAAFIQSLTNADIIICDDGMQHYSLARDMEICVMDGRGIGNGFLLPMGPMRETAERLDLVDYVLFNGNDYSNLTCLNKIKTDISSFALQGVEWVNVFDEQAMSLEDGIEYFASLKVEAMAGIGDPKRFFKTLRHLGIKIEHTHAFADHKKFTEADIPSSTIVLMTEKDAVKCKEIAHDGCWYLRVEADVPQAFFTALDNKIKPLLGEKPNGL
ncbi:tetraacyldisaccharide 4'-kinase [Agaribacter flavus]|uniref:Tetraacyldisaccharide 4'-kinase n=1 Tax=Agaribacter flavus TaxID=1902781 RepID=A0ABV7FP39_9ALTE